MKRSSWRTALLAAVGLAGYAAWMRLGMMYGEAQARGEDQERVGDALAVRRACDQAVYTLLADGLHCEAKADYWRLRAEGGQQ